MRLLVFVVLILGSALAYPNQPQPGVTLIYNESRPGEPSSMVRYIVRGNSMRTDFGPDSAGFVLFNGDEQTIYSVNDQDRSILIIHPPVGHVDLPDDLALGESRVEVSDVPQVGGAEPEHYRYTAGGQVCEDVYSVPGMLEDALPALRAYHTVLAREQLTTIDRIPPELRDPCEMARYVYAPTRHLNHGLLIRQSDGRGFLREFVTFRENKSINPVLFELPADYRRMSLSDLSLPLE